MQFCMQKLCEFHKLHQAQPWPGLSTIYSRSLIRAVDAVFQLFAPNWHEKRSAKHFPLWFSGQFNWLHSCSHAIRVCWSTANSLNTLNSQNVINSQNFTSNLSDGDAFCKEKQFIWKKLFDLYYLRGYSILCNCSNFKYF